MAVAVGVACVAFLAAVARHTRYGSSDNANALLAGQAMFHGNPLLRDWDMPHNSYWLLDLPIFGVASAMFGVGDRLLAAVPAAIATAAIAAGSVIAVMGRPPAKHWWVGAALVFILLGLPHRHLGLFLLQGPHHVATVVGCLVAFALLAGAGFGGARWAAAAAVLAVIAHSDPMAIAVGILPVAAAGLVDGVRNRSLGALVGPVTAAAAGIGGAVLLGLLLRLGGGYTPLPDPPTMVAWPENLRATPRILGSLLGVGTGAGLEGGALVAHVVGSGLFVAGIAASVVGSVADLIRRVEREEGGGRLRGARVSRRWLDDVLLLSCAAGAALFALLSDPELQVVNARYLLAPLIFGAVLAARRAVDAAAHLPAGTLAVGVVALAAAYGMSPLSTVRAPAPENPAVAVADWLAGRGLHHGYGQYWVAGLTTVSGRGTVAVRPVKEVDGTLRANIHFASRRWFGGDRPFRFVVVDPAHPGGVEESVTVATFGPPAEARDIGPYRVLVWDRDLAVPVDR